MIRALRFRGGGLPIGRRTLLVGVLNVTPDSFSDGGKFFSAAKAVAQGLRMREDGAAVVDVGGESTRPGSKPVAREGRAAGGGFGGPRFYGLCFDVARLNTTCWKSGSKPP